MGPYFAHHRTSCTPLHPYVTLHFEMLLKWGKWAKEVHTFQSADEVERKGNSSAALQVPFLATWVTFIVCVKRKFHIYHGYWIYHTNEYFQSKLEFYL